MFGTQGNTKVIEGGGGAGIGTKVLIGMTGTFETKRVWER